MIERLLYGRRLPTLYEIKLSAGEGSEEPVILFDEQLNTIADTREDAVYSAVTHKSIEEGIAIDYSMRLMRPGEIKEYVRPRIWSAIGKAATEQLLSTYPARLATNDALAHLTILNSAGRQEGAIIN